MAPRCRYSYYGRTAKGAVKDGTSLNELFDDLFRQHSPQLIKQKYATKSPLFDAPALDCQQSQR